MSPQYAFPYLHQIHLQRRGTYTYTNSIISGSKKMIIFSSLNSGSTKSSSPPSGIHCFNCIPPSFPMTSHGKLHSPTFLSARNVCPRARLRKVMALREVNRDSISSSEEPE